MFSREKGYKIRVKVHGKGGYFFPNRRAWLPLLKLIAVTGTLRSSGYTLSGIYFDDSSWSPRTNLPENAFLQPSFDVINIPINQFFSVIYTIPHTNPRVSAGVHTLAKKSCFSIHQKKKVVLASTRLSG